MSGGERMIGHIEYRPPDDLRLYEIPESGVLRLDDEALVAEVAIDGAVIRHYGFASHWLAVNVTTDLKEWPADLAGVDAFPHAVKCHMATPMLRVGDSCFQTDLWLDVLVSADGRDCHVEDEDEFADARSRQLLSERAASEALQRFQDVLNLVQAGTLLDWLAAVCPFRPGSPPSARPFRRLDPADYPELMPGVRPTW